LPVADYLPENVSTRTSALESVMFGVDVQSGDVRGDAPSYALVVLADDEVDRDVVTGRKLHRRIAAEEPAIVATDNVYELAEDRDDLVHLLRELPHGTRLVQVTGAQQPEPLSRVAKRHGVSYGKDPMQEAEAAARLAAANVGHEVRAFENTTTVKVSRGRSTGGGGWSEDRYTRKIHGAVKRRAREVESTLSEAGLEFEADVTEKYGGYANATFTVEARPEDVPVTTGRDGDVRVELERERTDGIEFEPLAKRRDPVVVGIDPGTTTAMAIVSLEGTLLDVASSRTADAAAVTEWIIERGRPVVVAADVTPMPETVEKFRRSFDATGWTPDRDLPVDEKLHRTRDEASDNDHERDAAAAALSAYDAHADQFERVAAKVPAERDLGTVLGRVLAEETSVEAVLADLAGEAGEEAGTAERPSPSAPSPEQRRIRQLEAQVERLEAHVDTLTETIEQKDERITEYEAELEDARRKERREARERQLVQRLERENDRLEREREDAESRVEELESKLERLKALWRLDHSNFADVAEERADLVPVKVVEQFTADAIADAQERFGLAPDDVILLRDASGAGRSSAERLAEIDPRIVLRNGNLSEVADEVLFEADVPVAPAEMVTVQEIDELAVARESEVEAAIEDWEERAAERERERTAEQIDQVISEHRATRTE
jgi:predicted RNase H-like nuclease (RuvC/YqgF family)